MIAIIDYGMGNLLNVKRGFEYFGFDAKITDNKTEILNADKVVLPGVGAFPDAMENLNNKDLIDVIDKTVKSGKPFMGICLGMQLMFSKGYEVKETNGLDIFKGSIRLLPDTKKIPHMGWNNINIKRECKILNLIDNDMYVYFVHSYFADVENKENIIATAEYSTEVPAVVSKDNVFGIQFHPEKSGLKGLNIYKRFGDIK